MVALTQDGQRVEIDVTVIFRISPANANTVHRNWQDRYVNGLVRPALRNQTRRADAIPRRADLRHRAHPLSKRSKTVRERRAGRVRGHERPDPQHHLRQSTSPRSSRSRSPSSRRRERSSGGAAREEAESACAGSGSGGRRTHPRRGQAAALQRSTSSFRKTRCCSVALHRCAGRQHPVDGHPVEQPVPL